MSSIQIDSAPFSIGMPRHAAPGVPSLRPPFWNDSLKKKVTKGPGVILLMWVGLSKNRAGRSEVGS